MEKTWLALIVIVIIVTLLLMFLAYRAGRDTGRRQGFDTGRRAGWIERHEQALQEQKNDERAAARARIRRR